MLPAGAEIFQITGGAARPAGKEAPPAGSFWSRKRVNKKDAPMSVIPAASNFKSDRQSARGGMSRAEREDLQRLVRQREKVLKSAAKQRSAELIADFENQLGAEYSFDDDDVWREATQTAEQEIEKANSRIARRCAELGIPRRFAPSIRTQWFDRGENAVKGRRAELRKMAQSRIEAVERKAIVDIEQSCLEAQTQLAISGLTSDAARRFIEQLPSVEKLMPALSFGEVAGEADPPVAEQLVTSNALRQRRYRERQALRNAPEALRDESGVTHNEGDEGGAP
jgi:hypothetical protein